MSKPVFRLDGDSFDDIEGLWTHMSERLNVERWHVHSYDCLNDALWGGCGTPDGGFVLEWRKSEVSRATLGADVFDDLVAMIKTHETPEDGGVELRLS